VNEVVQAALFRAYLSAQQEHLLRGWVGALRWAWNRCLEFDETHRACTGRSISYADLTKWLPVWKADRPWLAEVPAIALVDVVRQYCKARDRAFVDIRAGLPLRQRAGFPKFKRRKAGEGSVYLASSALPDLTRTHATKARGRADILRLGEVKLRGGRWPEGKLLACRLRLDGERRTFSVQFEAPPPMRRVAVPEPSVDVLGADGGLSALLTESDGTRHEAPRHLRKAEKKLKRLQRRYSRAEHVRKKEAREVSRRHARRLRLLGRQHRKVRDRRADGHHHLSSALTAKAAVIGVEDLAVKGMARNRHLAKSVADAGLSQLYRQIGYKAAWRGRIVHAIGRFDHSTGCCPDCGLIGKRLSLRTRVWTCEGCGAVHDRDHAAARWIERRTREWVGQGMPEPAEDTRRRRTRGESGDQRRGLGLRRSAAQRAANGDTDQAQPLGVP